MLSAIINAEAGPNTKDTTDAYLVGMGLVLHYNGEDSKGFKTRKFKKLI